MEKEQINAHTVTDRLSDEEMEAFARQLAQELPPEEPEREPSAKRDPYGCPHPLEDLRGWLRHPVTRSKRRMWGMIVLLALGCALINAQRIPLCRLLPAAQKIACVELSAVTADGGTDPAATAVEQDAEELLDILQPVYCCPQLFVQEAGAYLDDTYRAVFRTLDGGTVILVWGGDRIRITYDSGIELQLQSAWPYDPEAAFGLESILNGDLRSLWRAHGLYAPAE